MSDWPRKIPDRFRYRKAYVEALEAQICSLRRQLAKRHWTPVDVEAETQDGYSTPWFKEYARNVVAGMEQRLHAHLIAEALRHGFELPPETLKRYKAPE